MWNGLRIPIIWALLCILIGCFRNQISGGGQEGESDIELSFKDRNGHEVNGVQVMIYQASINGDSIVGTFNCQSQCSVPYRLGLSYHFSSANQLQAMAYQLRNLPNQNIVLDSLQDFLIIDSNHLHQPKRLLGLANSVENVYYGWKFHQIPIGTHALVWDSLNPIVFNYSIDPAVSNPWVGPLDFGDSLKQNLVLNTMVREAVDTSAQSFGVHPGAIYLGDSSTICYVGIEVNTEAQYWSGTNMWDTVFQRISAKLQQKENRCRWKVVSAINRLVLQSQSQGSIGPIYSLLANTRAYIHGNTSITTDSLIPITSPSFDLVIDERLRSIKGILVTDTTYDSLWVNQILQYRY